MRPAKHSHKNRTLPLSVHCRLSPALPIIAIDRTAYRPPGQFTAQILKAARPCANSEYQRRFLPSTPDAAAGSSLTCEDKSHTKMSLFADTVSSTATLIDVTAR
jgi:hypothetical protein